ncbi:MAG: glycerophosphodiester phosphodiesterase family protein, partial [Rubrivivax sp.]
AAHGYRAFECDVKLSADDVPFLLHDATLERTTAAEGVAGSLPWAELSHIDAGGWHSRGYPGEPLTSLSALAAYMKANAFALDLEIKPTPGTEHHTGQVVGREAARLWAGAESPPLLFSSFRPEALAGARETAAHIPRALLLDTLWPDWLAMAQQLACVAVITNYNVMSAQALAQIHGAGMRGLVYTVNDPAAAAWLRSIGIDGIITDAVARFSPAG